MGQLHFSRQLSNKSGAPHLVRSSWDLSCPSSLWGPFPGAVLIGLCHQRGDSWQWGSQFSDSYTPVAPLTHEVELGSFFSPVLPASPTSWPGTSLTFGHLCVVIMYKGPGWLRGGVFA